MPESAVEVLTSLGLPGVVILAMGWWIYRQDAKILAQQARIDDLQEQRVQDAQKIAAGVASLTDALDRQSSKLESYLDRRVR